VSKKDILAEVDNTLQANAGDLVEVSIPENMLIKVSMLVYLVPVIALMVGAFSGAALSGPLRINQSLSSVVLGFACMGMAFFVLKIYDRRARVKGDGHNPRMTRILIHNDD